MGTAPMQETAEPDLAAEVPCRYAECDQAADFQVRMHLFNRRDRDSGCSVRTVMLCTKHTERAKEQAAASAPKVCLCGETLATPDDIVLWVRPLR